MTDEELRQMFDAIHQENVAAHSETRRQFGAALEKVQTTEQLIAEAVQTVDQKLDRTAEGIRSEMRHGFTETQAMMKFSYVELDRRVSSLEDRVERLEKTKSR